MTKQETPPRVRSRRAGTGLSGTIQAQAKRVWLSLAAETDRGGRGSFLPRCKQTVTWLVFWALELFSGSAEVLPALTTAWLQP